MPAKKKRVQATPAPAAQKEPPAKPTARPPADSAAAQKYSALDAAALVLREAGQPMSCPELIAQMAAKGHWTSPKGKTPSATLYAALLREVHQKGAAARFQKTGPGRFAYRDDAQRS
jgi:HB1/ASXL restriction endonuclease-like protein with HTH domain